MMNFYLNPLDVDAEEILLSNLSQEELELNDSINYTLTLVEQEKWELLEQEAKLTQSNFI